MKKTLLVILVTFISVAALGIRVRDRCPRGANPIVQTGWAAFARGDVKAAGEAFGDAHRMCRAHVGALNGLGFVALRRGDIPAARRDFAQARKHSPTDADALVGGGIAAFQVGAFAESYALFTQAHAVDPRRPEPAEYLAEMPEGMGTPPPMPRFERPDSLVLWARTDGPAFEVRGPDGAWRPFYVKGVDLGAALPGKFASQFPDSATYAGWLEKIGAVGANALRVYTLHPPAFYGALRAYDMAHPDHPLWLIQGVWAELPADDDYLGSQWKDGFDVDLRTAVDIVHGRADVRPMRGRASGFYRADVSRWTLAYLIGREWEPYSVESFNRMHPELRGWPGRYIRADSVTPMEAVMARALDVLVSHEMDRYDEQRPVAFTNWPPLDPLTHPTEATQTQELAFRRALGEKITRVGPPFDVDAVSLDEKKLEGTGGFRGGIFASYHIYPYWPDFLVHEANLPDPKHRSGYQRYVRALRDHYAPMPLVVAEYGIPPSIGAAHVQPEGRDHGGLTEAQAAAILAQMTREISAAGAAGGVAFEWMDEWFKRSWVAVSTTIPLERQRMWKNAMNPEQYFGLVAMEAAQAVPGDDLTARLRAWRKLPPLAPAHDGIEVRAAADASYLWVLVQYDSTAPPARTFVGLDLWNPKRGAFRWPGYAAGPALPSGVEFAVTAGGGHAEVVGQPAAVPFPIQPIPDTVPEHPTLPFPLHGPPLPGAFQGRVLNTMSRATVPVADSSGRYDSLDVVLDGRRFTPDGREYPSLGYDRGALPAGNPPDGLWSAVPGALEVRIPWMLIDITDASARRALEQAHARPIPGGTSSPEFGEQDALATEILPGIRILAATRSADGDWASWPARATDGAFFTWPTWQQPEWTARLRPAYDSLREAFHTLPRTTLTLR